MSMRVALYCRVSTLEQSNEGVSLGAQEDRCRAFAYAKDWQVVQVYVDAGASGKSLQRPAMQRLLADAGQQVWDAVLTWRIDRLSRRQRDILYLLEDVFAPLGLGIQSATEAFDTTTPMGKAMLGMLSVFAQLERETIVERTKMGRAQSLKLGRWQGGRVPYGYLRTGRGQLTPDPITSPTVVELYTRASQGASPFQLAAWLNEQRIEAPLGGLWWDRVIEKLLKSPVYHGYVGRSDPHPGHHPALVETALWERVQRRFAARQVGPHADRPDFLVDGLLRCPQCSEPLRGFYSRPSPRPATSYDDPARRYRFYYVCARRRRGGRTACDYRLWHASDLHRQIPGLLAAWRADPAAVETALQAEFGSPPETADATWRIRQEAFDARVARWYDAFEQGAIDAATLRQRVDHIRQQQATLEAQRPVIPPTVDPTLFGIFRQVIGEIARYWPRFTAPEQQALLRLMIADGTITPTGQVVLRFNPHTAHDLRNQLDQRSIIHGPPSPS